MSPQSIIDSHIHLWPESAANSDGHGWMKPGEPLTKEHVFVDYRNASASDSNKDYEVIAAIYVETDRRYDPPTRATPLATWAKGPLDEIRFLRSIAEGQHGFSDNTWLLGAVLWAPLDQGPEVLEEWLQLAEETAGPDLWKRVRGFRFLLQAIHDREQFNKLVLSDFCIRTLRILAERHFAFDIGVDQNSGGTWQLETMAEVIKAVHEGQPDIHKTVFVLNHLCKPNFASCFTADGSATEAFTDWKSCMQRFAQMPNVYMKLSGAFSELGAAADQHSSSSLTADVKTIAQHLRPWTDYVFEQFGPERIMFGSDWPVCNVKGPDGESSWSLWRRVVEEICEGLGLSSQQRDSIWLGTVTKAYDLDRDAPQS